METTFATSLDMELLLLTESSIEQFYNRQQKCEHALMKYKP